MWNCFNSFLCTTNGTTLPLLDAIDTFPIMGCFKKSIDGKRYLFMLQENVTSYRFCFFLKSKDEAKACLKTFVPAFNALVESGPPQIRSKDEILGMSSCPAAHQRELNEASELVRRMAAITRTHSRPHSSDTVCM